MGEWSITVWESVWTAKQEKLNANAITHRIAQSDRKTHVLAETLTDDNGSTGNASRRRGDARDTKCEEYGDVRVGMSMVQAACWVDDTDAGCLCDLVGSRRDGSSGE